MKHILIQCDSCSKVVPSQSLKKWWGVQKMDGQMKFWPLAADNENLATGHTCSEACLLSVLKAFAETVDRRKKVAVAASPYTFGFGYTDYFSGWMNNSDTKDSIGYYKKKEDTKTEDAEDTEE